MKDTIINFIRRFLGIKKLENIIEKNFVTTKSHLKYNCQNFLIENLKTKIKNGIKIRVGFYVIYSASFPQKKLFELMLSNELFDPFILIIPDTARGEENTFFQLKKSFEELNLKYEGKVFLSYNFELSIFQDFSHTVDLIFFSNPYDNMTHLLYTSKYILNRKLYCHSNYAYLGRTKYEKHIISSDFYENAWKIFTESPKSFNEMIKLNPNLYNLNITGYSKMDLLSSITPVSRKRKKIIIAPHHTVVNWKNGLNLSNFMLYSDLFITIPKKYPAVDFVFRPHPLLFITLSRDDVWGEDKVQSYLNELKSIPNMTYDTSDDYFDLFLNSDGIIHDCGSFLAEYFYTDNPQCYMLNKKSFDNEFLDFGKEMLEYCYKAFNEKEINNFIDNVIIEGKDILKEKRKNFAIKNILFNYPVASECILEKICDDLL